MKLGIGEILIIIIVILFVIGPDRIPEFARKFGEGLKAFRSATSGITKEIRENVIEPLNEAQAPLREAMEPINEIRSELTSLGSEIKQDMQGIADELNKDVKNITDDLNQQVQDVKNELNQTGTAVKEAAEGMDAALANKSEAKVEMTEVPEEEVPAAEKPGPETVNAVSSEEGNGSYTDEAAIHLAREEAERRVAEAEKALKEAQAALTGFNVRENGASENVQM